jgi:dCTP deaminase
MILTGEQIEKAVSSGEIVIDPFDKNQISPNSYDFKLGDRCLIYKNAELDSAKDNEVVEISIPDDGLLLQPDKVYLINTFETMGSNIYVPIIRGRSSIGRLGIFIDITADLIDLGSINKWTLQLHSVMPVKIYKGMLIGQVTFWVTKGDKVLYDGKYKGHESPVKSFSYKDLSKFKK